MRIRRRTARIVRALLPVLRQAPADVLYSEMDRVAALWPERDRFIARQVMSSEISRRLSELHRSLEPLTSKCSSERQPTREPR